MLALLEKGRHATIEKSSGPQPVLVAPLTTATIHSNSVNEIPNKNSKPTFTPQSLKVISNNSFKNVSTKENKAMIMPVKTVITTTIQSKYAEPSTNPFDYSPTKEPQSSTPMPVTFFKIVSNFFKPVANFFDSIRRFLGFN